MARAHPIATLTTKKHSPAKLEKLVTQLLDDAKSEPRFRAARERDALINAICYNQTAIALSLLAHGAFSDLPDNKGRTALWHAAHSGRDLALIRALVQHGAKLPDDVLMGPVQDEDVETVRYLIRRGANVNCVAVFTRYSHQFPQKRNLLTEAISNVEMHEIASRTAIAMRAEMSAKKRRATAHKANTGTNGESIPILLIKAGAKPNRLAWENPVFEDYNRTILGLAAHCGLLHTVKAMLSAGADVNLKDTWGGTALIDAARQGHKQIIRILLSAGAKVNVKRKDGFTAASIAREHGFNELADEIERHAHP